MEPLRYWHTAHGYIVVFMFLTAVSSGSTCKAPSSPQCFRRNADETIYICEWNMDSAESDATYDLYFKPLKSSEKKFGGIKKTWCQFNEEQLIKFRLVEIWVEAHVGNSSCTSTKTSVVLNCTVKYEAPQNISMSWLKNNLNLSWTAVEKHPAVAEVRFRQHEGPTISWENRTINSSTESFKYQVTIENLLKDTAYQVEIRHRSSRARNPLWSDWSPVVIVPAELGQPNVSIATSIVNGTRKVTLTWKHLHAASDTGVTYSIKDTQSSHGCPCKKDDRENHTTLNKHTTYVSYSAVNITVIARNAAGYSPPGVMSLQPVSTAGLTTCEKTSLGKKLKKKTCLELYKFQDGDWRPDKVITSGTRNHKNQTVEDYIQYLYFEHRCANRTPQTVQMCLFYSKEGVPLTEPHDFISFDETPSSVELSWKVIPPENRRGFLTGYKLCIMKMSSQDEDEECYVISKSAVNHRLENLTPGAKYNISLSGVTKAGEGPRAVQIINTLPENPANALMWVLSLLFVMVLISTVCTCMLRQIKQKIFPPVPTPIIPNFSHYQPESQMLERKEEVDELILYQLQPKHTSAPEGAEGALVGGDWNKDEDLENERGDWRMSNGTSDVHLSLTDRAMRRSGEAEMAHLEQVDNEIAMLIYRNGLIFDTKPDSS